MGLLLQPELGVPFDVREPLADLSERAEAACRTLDVLQAMDNTGRANPLNRDNLGLSPPSSEEVAQVTEMASEYARDPAIVNTRSNDRVLAEMQPASLLLIQRVLQEFGRQIAADAVQIRHLVTNKLLLESDNDDPKVRLRALELLGKISEVGLFSEKREVTVNHKSTEKLRDETRIMITRIIDGEANVIPD